MRVNYVAFICFRFIYCSCYSSPPAHPHSRKERERRPQVVRRSAPDSGVLIRLKAQMAEVRSKMSDVKSQVLEARGESRPGTSGSFSVEDIPSHHADSEMSACRKPSELDLLCRGVAARSRPCRPGEDGFTLLIFLLKDVDSFSTCFKLKKS